MEADRPLPGLLVAQRCGRQVHEESGRAAQQSGLDIEGGEGGGEQGATLGLQLRVGAVGEVGVDDGRDAGAARSEVRHQPLALDDEEFAVVARPAPVQVAPQRGGRQVEKGGVAGGLVPAHQQQGDTGRTVQESGAG